MAEKNPIDIQKMIEQGTKVASLQDLQQKGFQKVKVLDEQTIRNLITQAVDRVVSSQTADERERISAESRMEFDRLMREQREMKSRAQLLETNKNELIERVETLQKELSVTLDVQQDTIHKKVQEITASLRKHADEANRRHQSSQQALTESCVEVDRLKEEKSKLVRELEEARKSAEELRRDLAREQEGAGELQEANAGLEERLQAAAKDLEKARAEAQTASGLQGDLKKREGEIAALREELLQEKEKTRAAEGKFSTVQWQVKEAQEKMEGGLKEARQAREDYDRLNAHNIRLMSEVQGLRTEVSKLRAGGAAAPAPSAPAAGPALAQLSSGKNAGKYSYMVTKIPPVQAGDKEKPGTAIDLPAGGDWDLVTVVREPDGSCLCFFKSAR